MSSQISEEEILEIAEKRVKDKKKFYSDFGGWAVVNIILIIVWALSGRGYPWFLWPLCIWGAFILMHYLRVFVFKQNSDKAAIEKEAEKIKGERR